MNDNFDKELKKQAEEESLDVLRLPEDYEEYIEKVLDSLPKRRKRQINWKGMVALAAALTATFSITVSAAVNYVKQRMEMLQEKEKLNYYSEAQYVTPADAYSRELTENEKERMEKLMDLYSNEGVFPEGELAKISDSSEYGGTGVAFMASRSTFFLPEGTMSDEELLQIIDFRAKREYSLQEAAEKREAGDTEALDKVQAPLQKNIDLKAEELEITFTGNSQLFRAAASEDKVYMGNSSELYQIDAGSGSLAQMDIQAPEGMNFSIMATDVQGNLCVLLIQEGLDRGNYGSIQLWKIAPDGNVLNKLDMTTLGTEKLMIPQALAVDKDGNYYVSSMHTAENNQKIYVLNRNGSLLSTIEGPDKHSDTRALGRGKDGRVYGVMMKGEDWIPCIVTFDVIKGSIADEYEDILPRDIGAYMRVSAGTDTDLLIGGTEGIYSYNLGDAEAKRTAALYDLPNGAAVSILPDGRAVFIDDEILTEQGSQDITNFRTKKIYLVKVN